MSELITYATQHISVDEYLESWKVGERGNRQREDDEFDNDTRRKKNRTITITISKVRHPSNPRPLLVKKFQRNADFTPLNTTPDRILSLHKNMCTNPQPMYKDPSMRDKKVLHILQRSRPSYRRLHPTKKTNRGPHPRKKIKRLIMVANLDTTERRHAARANEQQDH